MVGWEGADAVGVEEEGVLASDGSGAGVPAGEQPRPVCSVSDAVAARSAGPRLPHTATSASSRAGFAWPGPRRSRPSAGVFL